MHTLSILFFALSSSSDNFVIGLSYGAKKIKIRFINNLLIALISCIGTIAAMLFGKLFIRLIAPGYTNMLGSSILMLFGLFMLLNTFKKKSNDNKELTYDNSSKVHHYNEIINHPEAIDKNNSNTIEFKEAIVLGIILCINNIGLGIGASISGLNIYITSLSSLIFSILFIKLGYYFGSIVTSGKLAKYSEIISACVIILLGIYELFI
ncbi:sporulation membrane protein YtaF [Clostridium estertheticum]|uniref:sporulation membrane protein YtaF n=1 Tax=Clostridium estertheticum TaxID=238834 RepID=UPI0013E8FFDB|nr:sporulation membrane protein YtaF [Clostridium estertheticum]MBZ9686909.1 sporulation membrane protein YtaF [Clostridium estertheticum]